MKRRNASPHHAVLSKINQGKVDVGKMSQCSETILAAQSRPDGGSAWSEHDLAQELVGLSKFDESPAVDVAADLPLTWSVMHR